MNGQGQADATIGFGEKLLELLDQGSFTATYKHAVLLALIDIILEKASATAEPPASIRVRDLAEKVIDFYWPHTLPFAGARGSGVLRQNVTGQAEIVSLITRFRESKAADPSAPLFETRLQAAEGFDRLVDDVEWKLIEMPLPRLQVFGAERTPFIYDIHWDLAIRRSEAFSSGFDRRIFLKEGAGEDLIRLSGLLRPLIQ